MSGGNVDRETCARVLAATFKFNTYERLPEIKAPTLAIAGADDALMPARNSEIIAGCIAGAQVKLILGASHMFFNQECAAFVSALAPFLKAHPMHPRG
jgi:pimeloyl-ACP methyl ester carboxylesterase